MNLNKVNMYINIFIKLVFWFFSFLISKEAWASLMIIGFLNFVIYLFSIDYLPTVDWSSLISALLAVSVVGLIQYLGIVLIGSFPSILFLIITLLVAEMRISLYKSGDLISNVVVYYGLPLFLFMISLFSLFIFIYENSYKYLSICVFLSALFAIDILFYYQLKKSE